MRYRERLERAQKANKSATKEERLEIERKLMEQVEAEGIRAEAEVERSTGQSKTKVA